MKFPQHKSQALDQNLGLYVGGKYSVSLAMMAIGIVVHKKKARLVQSGPEALTMIRRSTTTAEADSEADAQGAQT